MKKTEVLKQKCHLIEQGMMCIIELHSPPFSQVCNTWHDLEEIWKEREQQGLSYEQMLDRDVRKLVPDFELHVHQFFIMLGCLKKRGFSRDIRQSLGQAFLTEFKK